MNISSSRVSFLSKLSYVKLIFAWTFALYFILIIAINVTVDISAMIARQSHLALPVPRVFFRGNYGLGNRDRT